MSDNEQHIDKPQSLSGWGKFAEIVKYPSNSGQSRVTERFYTRSLVSTATILAVGRFASAIAGAQGYLEPEAAAYISEVMVYGVEMSMVGAVLSGGYAGLLSYREVNNRVLYGNLLTVGKVSIHDSDYFKEVVPDAQSHPYYGELHIIGKRHITNPFARKPSRREVYTEGVKGFKLLAEAAKEEDPRLKDIEIFAGGSLAVSPGLSKLGFTVIPWGEISPQRKKREPGGYCYISRQALIDNLPNIEKIASRVA